jgi:hypothetical protein
MMWHVISATLVSTITLVLLALSSDSGAYVSAACVNDITGHYDFDGSTGRLTTSLTGSQLLASGSFSLAFWSRRASSNTYDVALSMGNNQTTDMLLSMGYRDGGASNTVNRFYFGFYRDDVDAPQAYAGDELSWHHWVGVYDSTTQTQSLYRDGFLVNRRKVLSAFTPYAPGSTTLVIGTSNVSPVYSNPKNSSDWSFHGQLDEIAVFSRALSDAEVLQGASSMSFGSVDTTGEILYLRFNNGEFLTDSSPANTQVTAVGGVSWQPNTINPRCVCGLGLCSTSGTNCVNSKCIEASYSLGLLL